jgi:hypothetical protein
MNENESTFWHPVKMAVVLFVTLIVLAAQGSAQVKIHGNRGCVAFFDCTYSI